MSAQFADGFGLVEQSFHRRGAQCHDDFRVDQIDLFQQKREAGFHFVGGGLAVAGTLAGGVGAAFEDVGDVNGFAGEAHCLDDACQ